MRHALEQERLACNGNLAQQSPSPTPVIHNYPLVIELSATASAANFGPHGQEFAAFCVF